ncbi:TPA: hypothetical protein DGH83_02465 [Candidatus Peregrinibacteria bacterium]|nr:hypothetical protein [Candidatus Peregrinibacteria bacterium]
MVVHPGSGRISRVRPYLRTYLTEAIVFADGAITLYGGPFQGPLTNNGTDYQHRQILENRPCNTTTETAGTYHAAVV